MKMRTYYTWYQELNRYLEDFPPFEQDQLLPDDKVKEHIEFAIPNSWQKQMILQGFNAVTKTIEEIIELCEH